MNAHPVTENCHRHFQTKSHICFGISPFNSYFSEERIRDLALWGKREFDSMHFFVPDVPSAYTLEALGYDSEKAAWKARRQTQYLHNKIERALKGIGFSQIDAWEMILNWERLSKNARFQELYEQTKDHFDNNPKFQASCLEASKWVLERRVPDADALDVSVLKSAVRYLLAEMPLFLDAGGIVGRASSVFCYHQCPRFIEALFQGKHPLRVSEGQGFLIVEPRSLEGQATPVGTRVQEDAPRLTCAPQ